MSTTVREIYNRTAYDMLEDGALVLGIVTDAQFLHYLEEAILEFCEQIGLVKKIFTQYIRRSVSQYLIPDDILKCDAAFVGGVYIEHYSLEELYNSEYEWPKRVGQPLGWFEDGLPVSTLQLMPIPDFDGTPVAGPAPPFGAYGEFSPRDRNLTTVGASRPSPIALTLSDTIPAEVPDSFTAYLVYRILWRIFSTDGEAKDLQRAAYCDARWKEGVSLGQAILLETVNDNK